MNNSDSKIKYGSILLIGSGETTSTGRILHEQLFKKIDKNPIYISVLETPAGFETNSEFVAQEVDIFFNQKLQNYHPVVEIIHARRNEGLFSTNSDKIVSGIKNADHIYLGAGSPTYLAKHLRDSLAMKYIRLQHEKGSSICLTSASSIAFSKWLLPVYEIFKVGEDLHWDNGLDFFQLFNLDISVIPHWNNNDGGLKIDTSHCYLGKDRMGKLIDLLPTSAVIIGIDEHTGLLMDFDKQIGFVIGKGSVYVLKNGIGKQFSDQTIIPFGYLGAFNYPNVFRYTDDTDIGTNNIPLEIKNMAELRWEARKKQHWEEADELRFKISELGYFIKDSIDGYDLING